MDKKFPSAAAIFCVLTVIYFATITSCEPLSSEPKNDFPASRVNAIAIDKEGVVWAGTDVGIISFRENKWMRNEEFNTGEVFDVVLQSSCNGSGLWIATSDGLFFAEYSLNQITNYSAYRANNSGLLDDRIRASILDSD